MSFLSQMVGTFTFKKESYKEIAESEDLTSRGWLLLIGSSLIAGLCISAYILHPIFTPDIDPVILISGLIIPTFFCFFFGFDLAWAVVAINKNYSVWEFFTFKEYKGLRDPDFNRAIRLMGYASLVLVFSGLVLIISPLFYQYTVPSANMFNNLLMLGFIIPAGWLGPFFFPYVMFLNPLANPLVFFFVWQAIVFMYGYNTISEKEAHGKNYKGLIIGFIGFNLFWIVVTIAVILATVATIFYLWAHSD